MNTTRPSTKPRLLLIGNGMAGARCLEELLKLAPDKYHISVISEEACGNYNRIMLSPVLAGETTLQNIMLNDQQWYQQQSIRLYTGQQAVTINRRQRRVTTDKGLELSYDRLLLATGSIPSRIPVPGNDLNNIFTFRDINDVNQMLEASQQRQHVAVIGGGLLGLEAANGLKMQGMDVTLVHSSSYLLNKQLDATAAELLRQTLTNKGIQFLFNARTVRLSGNAAGDVSRLHFQDGRQLKADMVIMAVGITPNIRLAQSCGLLTQQGILVNDVMQTYDPAIYAIGECIQHRGQLFGLVAPLYEQAKVCANQLAELGHARYLPKTLATQLKITGIKAFSAGRLDETDHSESLCFYNHHLGYYKKLILEGNQLTGAILYGDTLDSAWYFELIQQKTDIQPWRDQLIFGKDFCPT